MARLPQRRLTLLGLGAAIAALTAVALAGCGDTVVVVQAPTTTAYVTAPTTADVTASATTSSVAAATAITSVTATTTPTSSAASPAVSGGTLIVTLGTVGNVALTADQAALAIIRLHDRAAALGYDATAAATADGAVQVTIRGVAAADQDRVATELASFSGQVYLRPVLIDDRFGIPCVTGPDRSAPTSGSTAATTTIVGATALPDVPADTTGYLLARGGSVCNVGPAGGTGDVFVNAHATLVDDGSDWGVTATLKTGPTGEGVWNTLAGECFNGAASCPTHQLAIELDGVVIAAPSVQVPEFHGDVQISGSFTEAEAQNLAEILNRGALPVRFAVQARSYLPG